MKETLRQSMAWLHTWTGLVTGWVLFFVFVTGTAGYFQDAISIWMKPAAAIEGQRDSASFTTVQNWLSRKAPEAQMWGMDLPSQAGAPVTLWWKDESGDHHNSALDPRTGAEVREGIEPLTHGGLGLYRMHYALHYIPNGWAIRIVGICTMLMLLAILTGVITHKKIFKDFFTFRPAKGQRSWLDAHNLISVTALPFFLMITWSGLVFFLYTYMPAGIEANFGQDWERYEAGIHGVEEGHENEEERLARSVPAPMLPLPQIVRRAEAAGGGPYTGIRVDLPGDAKAVANLFPGGHPYSAVTGDPIIEPPHDDDHHSEPLAHGFEETLLWLHEGIFAGPLLRWLYFGSGLLGCAMIATGLVLWTVKRRQKQMKAGKSDVGFRLVEALNIGTIAGLPIGIATYFLANRLLPLDVPYRADWEMHCLFIAWGLALLWAAIRTPGKAWVEVLGTAAAALALVPIVNAVTTGRHLLVTLPDGDWLFAGFDIVMLLHAAFFALAAIRTHSKWSAPSPQPRRRIVEATV